MDSSSLTQIGIGGVVIIAVMQFLKLVFNFLVQYGKIGNNKNTCNIVRCVDSKEGQTALSNQGLIAVALKDASEKIDKSTEKNTKVHLAQGVVLKDILKESEKSNTYLEEIANNHKR